jgi:hypothetical protein
MPASMLSEWKSRSKVQPTIIHPSASRAPRDIHFFIVPAILAYDVVRGLRVDGRTRVVCGRAPVHSAPSCGHHSENARDQEE